MQSVPHVILVPTDFGELANDALSSALAYARAFGAKIVLLHAYEVPTVAFPDGAFVVPADLHRRIEEASRAALDEMVRTHDVAGIELEPVVCQGEPCRAILDAARSHNAELIVMGTHGRKGLSRALLGSVAEKVVRSSRVAVLTIHGQPRERVAQV